MNQQSQSPAQSRVVIERTYRARVEELWALWTTKEGFESWWGPEGFRSEVHTIAAHLGGTLHYDMIAVEPAQIAAMKQMGRASSHAVRARFTEIRPHRRLTITSVIDFVPGVKPYESTIMVEFFSVGERARMVVTLEPMHDEELTQRSLMGFTSQLSKLEPRFGEQRGTLSKVGKSSTQKIVPHLWYAKEAHAAARFYVTVFPDSRIDRATSLPAETPSGPAGSVDVVEFTLLGQAFMAISAGPHDVFNDAISLLVSCDSQAEIDHYWSSFLENGGKPQGCGWIIDKYGVRWQIVPSILREMIAATDTASARRAVEAMLKQKKLDIEALEAAFAGR